MWGIRGRGLQYVVSGTEEKKSMATDPTHAKPDPTNQDPLDKRGLMVRTVLGYYGD